MFRSMSNFVEDRMDYWVFKFVDNKKQSAVLAALRFAQKENGGFLSVALMDEIAEYLSIPKMSVYEVASFYSMYELKQNGKYKICICTNISCMLAGSGKLIDYIKLKLGVGFNEVTLDKKFYIKEVECLASCAGAPVIQIGTSYYENITIEKLNNIITELD